MNADSYVELKPNRNIPDFRVGDTVRVHATVIEGDRRRIQAFEGVVIRIRKGGVNSTFTVRRVSHGVGIERVFPYFSPLVDKVEVTRVGKVRRAKLYYLRERVGKAARLKPGPRARFEALTNRPFVEETEVEDILGGEAEEADEQAIAEGAAAAVETEAEGEAPEAPEGEAAPAESAAEATAEPQAEAEAEAPAEEPQAAAEAEAPAEEPQADAEAEARAKEPEAAAEEAEASPEEAAADAEDEK